MFFNFIRLTKLSLSKFIEKYFEFELDLKLVESETAFLLAIDIFEEELFDSSKSAVKIEHALNCISFLVIVPVLSLKMYFTKPRSLCNVTERHFISSPLSFLKGISRNSIKIDWSTFTNAKVGIILDGNNV